MDTHNRITFTHFNTCSDYPVHLLFHLSIPALNSIKVTFLPVLSLNHTGGRATTNTDAVSGPTDLYYFHALFRYFFFYMAMINLSNTACKHNWFYPLPPMAAGQPQAECSGKHLDYRLAGFIFIILRTIAFPYHYLYGRR